MIAIEKIRSGTRFWPCFDRSARPVSKADGLQALQMVSPFNRAENDSPRSGSSKRVTPAVWAAIVVAMVVVAIWFAMKL